MARAAVIIIGNEILSGKFADENARFLIGELRQLGVELGRITIIPDEVDDIAETVPRVAARFDAVFTSGGVGPTHDDVTMAGVARGFGTSVVRHPALEARLREYYGDRLTDSHLRLAEVPDGAELVHGDDQVWPVIAYRNVYILPGVPSLFRRKFLSIRERFRSRPFFTARIYVMADEAAITTDLDRVVAAHPQVAFGSYPRFEETEYRVLLTVESHDREAVARAAGDLAAALGAAVVRVEDGAPPADP
ncbi:MAG TPA: competence/damage-inducible protein A [Kofleriaceae bacterium]|nr:competence/damage-inducible protein A [Kofleriaceae bacterium]